ncbi:hypothetical protein [Rhabdochromatium marinum]|uniref:hypothetical protein n=1 Tax=Rhabdochromatium marinum TaxID=48729 RepID=UPI001903BF6A|nr:hypothetical protein [Rhabdochromatium marinum]MBK1648560.1 hypothetical protein [Rhabdochromatium marinum]
MKTTKAVVELQPEGRKTVFNACTEPCSIEQGSITYNITDFGRSSLTVLEQLKDWTEANGL